MVQNAKTTEERSPTPPTVHQDQQTAPAFKPVGMPALKAAMRAVRPQPRRVNSNELPAILRKDASLG